MFKNYSGVRVHVVSKNIIDKLYSDKTIDVKEVSNVHEWYENLYLVMKDETGGQSSALAKVKNNKIILLNNNLSANNIVARNKEQKMALDALLDDSIRVVVLTGTAGSGKTLLSLAAALEKMQNKNYSRVVLTRTMTNVGKEPLGILPGSIEEKFSPYLGNYMCNLEYMLGGDRSKVQYLIDQAKFEFVPIQLIRGMSWMNTFIIADELQNVGFHETLTLGTRVGENSKLVILGDLNQRDEKIAKDKTGIFKFINSSIAQNSPLVASIELIKSERSEVATIFASVFED